MPLFFSFESNKDVFLIVWEIIKFVLGIFLALLNFMSSFAHIFIFLVLHIILPSYENKYISYWLNSNDFSLRLLTMLWVSFVVEFLSFKVLLMWKRILIKY